MEHIQEFNIFGGKSRSRREPSKLEIFLQKNWGSISVYFKSQGLAAEDYIVETDNLFTVKYSPQDDEMPSMISYMVDDITKKISKLTGDPQMIWRFGYDDPFSIRFFLIGGLR